jgi:hypothetical protein
VGQFQSTQRNATNIVSQKYFRGRLKSSSDQPDRGRFGHSAPKFEKLKLRGTSYDRPGI